MCCTVCKSGPRGGACVLYCLQIWPPVAPMCCTVCKSGPRWRQCAVLSPNLAPGKAPMCCTVCTSGSRGEPMWCTVCKSCPRGRQCRVLSPNLAPGCANVLHCLPTWPPKAPIRGRCASVRVCACAGVGVLGRGTGISGKEITKGMTKKLGAPMCCTVCKSGPGGGPGLRCRASHLRRRAPHLGSSHPADVASRPCCCSISSMSLCCAHELAVQYAIQLLPFNRQRSGGRRSLCPPLIKPGLMCNDATLRFLNFN